jgi:predicted aminopeptidase
MTVQTQRYKSGSGIFLFILGLISQLLLMGLMLVVTINHQMSLYLLAQAKGELKILSSTTTFEEYKKNRQPAGREASNLALIDVIRQWSVDSFAFRPTGNFTRIFDQNNAPALWAVSGCGEFSFESYQWKFPLIGWVDYKGYFNKAKARSEFNRLRNMGYDAELRQVSGWSTLGWLNDPLLSNMLKKSKGAFCNLLFHELFHATWYAPGATVMNENLASFVAHQATLRFLSEDTVSLREYMESQHDNEVFRKYILKQITSLSKYYVQINHESNRRVLKLRALIQIGDSIAFLPLRNVKRYAREKEEILQYKNAYFGGYSQYETHQDSLQNVFNIIYRRDLKKMVRHLRQSKTID